MCIRDSVYTGYRPTPLTHYIFPAGASGIYQIVDEKANFKSEQFHKAVAAIKKKPNAARDGDGHDAARGGKGKGRQARGAGSQEPSDCQKLVSLIVSKGYDPLIVFAFGKAKCETLARQMGPQMHLNSAEESAMVETIFNLSLIHISEPTRPY